MLSFVGFLLDQHNLVEMREVKQPTKSSEINP